MSTFKSAGDHYRRAILAAALVGGTVAAGVAAYLAFTRKKSAEPKSKKDKVVKEPTTSDVKDEMLSVRQPVKVDISRASPSDTSLQLSTDPLASPPLSLDSPTSIEIISMTESMGPDSLMMSSDFVQLDASANASLQSTPPLLEAIPDEETLSTEHLKIKDENDIVVIEDQRHTRDEKSSEDKEESSPSLSDTHIGGEEESSGSGTVKIEPEDDSTVGGESSKGSNSDIEVLEHPQDESLETIDSDNTDTEAKTPIPESSPALPEAPVESVTEETVHASIPVDTSERPATPEPVEQSTDATQEDVPSDSDVDVTTVTEEETLGDGQETLPYEEKHTDMHPTEDHFEDESLVSHIKITHPKDVETLLSFGMKLRTRKQQDNKYICKHYIESVAENSTAAQIGLCDNDELVCLNNMSVSSWSHSVLVEQLRVLPAEQFELTVSSSGATHRLKVHLKAEAEGVNVGSESFDISGQQITPDHLPVLTYQAGHTGLCVLEYKADGTFVHVSEDGLEVCTMCNDDPNSTPSTPALVACDALTFDVSDTDYQAVVIRGSVAMDSLFVTALSYTQLGLQRKERLAEDFETLRHPDPRVFYKHALSDDAICLESSQIRGFYIASDGRKVFLKDMATLESCEHDPQVQFQLSCPEVK